MIRWLVVGSLILLDTSFFRSRRILYLVGVLSALRGFR